MQNQRKPVYGIFVESGGRCERLTDKTWTDREVAQTAATHLNWIADKGRRYRIFEVDLR